VPSPPALQFKTTMFPPATRAPAVTSRHNVPYSTDLMEAPAPLMYAEGAAAGSEHTHTVKGHAQGPVLLALHRRGSLNHTTGAGSSE
jgi:hypothetical protein